MHTHQPPVIAISGVKNSGKTTLLVQLLPLLVERGLKVAVVKHVFHGFAPDVPGTDSFRHRQAGAYGVAAYDDRKFSLVKEGEPTAEAMIEQFPDADLILLEGAKNSDWPKLELVRETAAPVGAADTLLAIISDQKLDTGTIPLIPFARLDLMVEVIISFAFPGQGDM